LFIIGGVHGTAQRGFNKGSGVQGWVDFSSFTFFHTYGTGPGPGGGASPRRTWDRESAPLEHVHV